MIKYKRVPLETMHNVRDLGGYAADGGKITRYGVFLRTDCPINISANDINYLRDYGITLSVDLRGNDEAAKTPSAMSNVSGHRYVHCPISEDHSILKSNNSSAQQMPHNDNSDLGNIYINIAETGKLWVKRVITLCAEWNGGVMFHCFIGKDRAGIISALLLGACGVSWPDILADYSASMSCLRPVYDKMQLSSLPSKRGRPDYTFGFFGSVPESMEALLFFLQENYGGITEYLRACDIPDETLLALREKLLENAAD